MNRRLPPSLCWRAPLPHTEQCQLPCTLRQSWAWGIPRHPLPTPCSSILLLGSSCTRDCSPCPIPCPQMGSHGGHSAAASPVPATYFPDEPWRAAWAAELAQSRGRLRGRKTVFSQPWLLPAATAASFPGTARTGAMDGGSHVGSETSGHWWVHQLPLIGAFATPAQA